MLFVEHVPEIAGKELLQPMVKAFCGCDLDVDPLPLLQSFHWEALHSKPFQLQLLAWPVSYVRGWARMAVPTRKDFF